jgi:hypothetical protein
MTLPEDLAVVRRVDARYAFDEHGLARSVVAAQRSDFAGREVKVDVVQRWTGPKCLSNSLILRSGSVVAGASATAAMSLCIIEDREGKSDAAASCGGVI